MCDGPPQPGFLRRAFPGFRRVMGSLLTIALLVFAGFSGWLFVAQERMIYFPRRYAPELVRGAEAQGFRRLEFATSQGRQTAFLLPPGGGAAPGALVVIFCGNASTGLDWASYALARRNPGAAVLLFDYPGYGLCEGRPSPAAILESSKAAMNAAAAALGVKPQDLAASSVLLGHSLGAAAAFQLAADTSVKRVIAVAPFTTMLAMAERSVSKAFAWLLRHRFDNRDALGRIAGQASPPAVVILHGAEDEVIPFRMGRELAETARLLGLDVTFIPAPGCGHNDAADVMETALREACGL